MPCSIWTSHLRWGGVWCCSSATWMHIRCRSCNNSKEFHDKYKDCTKEPQPVETTMSQLHFPDWSHCTLNDFVNNLSGFYELTAKEVSCKIFNLSLLSSLWCKTILVATLSRLSTSCLQRPHAENVGTTVLGWQ